MTQELAQIKEANPILQPSAVHSKARGYENIAKVLGNIAERSIEKVTDYATEASKTNLLQTKSMLDDVSAKSKLEMLKNPEHADIIAKNAEQTTNKIKSIAKLNRQDRVNLDLAAKDINRDLTFKAQEKSIQMTNEAAKYSILSAFNGTLRDISTSLYTNPEAAEKTIEAQYQALAGQVRAGILTAVEAANLHKQLEHELDRASIILEGYRQENLSASDVNALHAASPEASQPFSNSNLPMAHDTMIHADNHLTHLTNEDIKSKWAQGGYVAPLQLAGVKKLETLQTLLRYKAGTAQATGDIQSGMSWNLLKKRLDLLQKTDRLNTEQTGYKDRLNNYMVGIERDNQYANYVSNSPAGAQAYLDYTRQHAIINQHQYFGDEKQIAEQRHQAGLENLNNLVSKLDAVGIGADVPDQYRTAVPLQYVQPILDAFSAGANPNQAINNIAIFNPKNRAILANSTPDPRKALTIYETGQLIGKADQGFLSDLWHSQQDNSLSSFNNGKETKSKFLQQDKSGKTASYIRDEVNARLIKINQYLGAQALSRPILDGFTDKALRYINYVAEKNADPRFDHLNDYIKTYTDNMLRAYDIKSSNNYILDRNVIPLDEAQMSLLARHAIADVHDKLREYMNEAQVIDYMSKNQLRVVNSTQGRIAVINGAGQLIPDKNGHPAFYEMYTEGILRLAEHDKRIHSDKKVNTFFGSQVIRGFL